MSAPRTSRPPAARCRTSAASMPLPARLRLNQWALAGDWTVGKQAIALNRAGGRIAYRFHARDLNLVMGPAARGTSVRFRVLDRRAAARRGARGRRRRPGQRHGDRAAAVSADPATEARRRPTVRDRVSRRGRGGVCVHVRLNCGRGTLSKIEVVAQSLLLRQSKTEPAAGSVRDSLPRACPARPDRRSDTE